MPRSQQVYDGFINYRWEDKHKLYGYPADTYPRFLWINSLEERFLWLSNNINHENTASIYLIREMIQWGGSQNGVIQKFDEGIGEINLLENLKNIIDNINDTEAAIESALQIPGMGLTYASKMLRFIHPEKYGALDSRLRKAIQEKEAGVLPKIYDGNVDSMKNGYARFIEYLDAIKTRLENEQIFRPDCTLTPAIGNSTRWRSADIEMALFQWAST